MVHHEHHVNLNAETADKACQEQTWAGFGEAAVGGRGGDGEEGLGEGLGEGVGEGVAEGLGEGGAVLLGRIVVLEALPGPAFWLLLVCPCRGNKHPSQHQPTALPC